MNLDAIAAYSYELPADLIAQQPITPRDHSRLLVYDRATGATQHRQFFDLPEFLRPGDCLVLNQTRVVPARLHGVRDLTGGKWQGLFLRLLADGCWELIGQTKGKIQPGETISILHEAQQTPLQLRLLERDEQARWRAEPLTSADSSATAWELLDQFGSIPLPPYIQHGQAQPEDRSRYQTVFAETAGAVAAPTAGLHFTPELLERVRQVGVEIATVTLHVGLGTFRPVSVEQLQDHAMHAEWCEVTPETVAQLQRIKQQQGRVIAVGTTTVRTLETAAQSGELQAWQGESTLFIRPGFPFRVVDGLITNYHLPQSTLLVLLAAFMGYDEMLATYQTAIEERYRFYSYGDAMGVF